MDDLQQDTRIFNQNLDRAEAKIQQLQAQIDTLNTAPASAQD
jgi:ubiquinone biosynthesis protein UbiJ